MSTYNIIAETDKSTVVSNYIPEAKHATDYQSEADLERELIRLLGALGYEYITISSEADLINNLRKQLEQLNDILFSDSEWSYFFESCIANRNDNIVDKTYRIQADHIQILHRDDGTTKNIYLLDKKRIHNNRLQVINQYEQCTNDSVQCTNEERIAKHDTRYDVTILVNGLPLVHIELKRRGVAIREAFNQIDRYQRDSFWAGCGLFEYVQIFVISNGTNTKYYSNTTRFARIREAGGQNRKGKKTSNSFEFTSYWADAENKVIADLVDFTKTFFAKHAILNILTKYCVFTSEQLLLVMRPYQIAATERILNRIAISTTYRKTGSVDAGGYIWHTTGSGKTLTSFKTAQLATSLDYIDKVLFVVDRKDLDYQTMKEYDRFEKGAANGNTSTKVLTKQLENPDAKIIITTIQKLSVFISKNKAHDVYKKHVVLIFDECHRSQFGDMHTDIVKAFKNYHIFGFTGTPIFAENAGSACLSGRQGKNPHLKTTAQAFGEQLHTYTIIDAIGDSNVLPFRIDYINTVKKKEALTDKKVRAIDIENALNADERIKKNVGYILEHFDQKTKRNASYTFKRKDKEGKSLAETHVFGFNSIFAVQSIAALKLYYTELKRQIEAQRKGLTVATIFSFAPNEETDVSGFLADEDFDTSKLDKSSRDFLDGAIADYNAAFGTSYSTDGDKFQNYYKDLSLRVKNREVDILLVVDMFLTGFDATTLNTLWVDKNLRMHGLIQAFSRTNRILNSVKTYGNIVCFRDLENETNEAIALFGDKNASGAILLKSYKDYYNGFTEKGKQYPGYADLIAELGVKFPLGFDIIGEESQKEFIRLYGAILKLKNILSAFDDFLGNEILPDRDFQDYQSVYIDLYQSYRKKGDSDKESILGDIEFEIDLVKQVEVNIDYILMLVEKYHAANCEDKTILISIRKAIGASMELRSKRELIEGFIERLNVQSEVDKDWKAYIAEKREADLAAIIAEEKLKDVETRRYIDNAFRDGVLKTIGTDIDKILPPTSRFFGLPVQTGLSGQTGGGNRAEKKQAVIDKLQKFFEKYLGTL
jgi:type I restriction enzyme R subunit